MFSAALMSAWLVWPHLPHTNPSSASPSRLRSPSTTLPARPPSPRRPQSSCSPPRAHQVRRRLRRKSNSPTDPLAPCRSSKPEVSPEPRHAQRRTPRRANPQRRYGIGRHPQRRGRDCRWPGSRVSAARARNGHHPPRYDHPYQNNMQYTLTTRHQGDPAERATGSPGGASGKRS